MKYLLILLGAVFTITSLYYFIKLIYYLLKSFEITDYGYGILVGNIIILIIGGALLYFGIKRKK